MSFGLRVAAGLGAVVAVGLLFTFTRPPVLSVQRGYRGTGMQQIYNPRRVQATLAANVVPDPEPPQDPAGQPSSAVYQNVQVLKDLDANEFLRLMAAITTWVAPEQGCTYCHSAENLADDSLYTKRVARRMIQMVEYINTHWTSHVGATGVTCYTCHRGMPVPANIWFKDPGQAHFQGMVQAYTSKNHPNAEINGSSLPRDVFTPFLDQDNNIRVASTTALPTTDNSSIKQTEWTYGLMIHFTQALGVNCTYCHSSRAFSDWSQSSPQRTVAWYGIRMVRALNTAYLEPLLSQFPANRLGQLGDVPKINCNTCHQGVFKPLYGVSMLKDYPELKAGYGLDVKPQASAAPAATEMQVARQ